MHGWLFQQGSRAWGYAITWHIADLGFMYEGHGVHSHAPKYDRFAHLWTWSQHAGWQSKLILSDGSVQRADVESWMVHTEAGDKRLVTQRQM